MPPSLEAAIYAGHYELSIKLPPEINDALNKGIILNAEDIRRYIERDKREVLNSIDVEVLYDYDHLPVILVKPPAQDNIERAALAHEGVEAFRPPQFFETFISASESSAQIGAGLMRELGFDGTGASVLVTDSDLTINSLHPDFGQCTGFPNPSGTCKLQTYLNYGNDFDSSNNSVSHGTNVSGIVALTAPGVRIHHANIGCGTTTNPRCISGSQAMLALNWAIQNRSQYNIVAHNMSWGSSGSCTYSSAMAVGTAAGIVQVAAAGNDSTISKVQPVGSPANCTHVVSVGAVNTTQGALSNWRVASFSNASSALDFLAPGVSILAGHSSASMTGTSQASPHVTAVASILQAPNQWNLIPPANLESAMKRASTPFLDTRVNLSFPLVNAYRSRILTINIANPDGALYQMAPPAPKSCGANCFNYPEAAVSVTHPAGYFLTGCAKTSPTSCTLHINNSRTHRLLRISVLGALMSRIALPDRESTIVFQNGFEN
jgi:hypothetical protein